MNINLLITYVLELFMLITAFMALLVLFLLLCNYPLWFALLVALARCHMAGTVIVV